MLLREAQWLGERISELGDDALYLACSEVALDRWFLLGSHHLFLATQHPRESTPWTAFPT